MKGAADEAVQHVDVLYAGWATPTGANARDHLGSYRTDVEPSERIVVVVGLRKNR